VDFRFSPEEETFRQEVRDFLRKHAPAEYANQQLGDKETEEFRKRFARALGEKGWLAVSWPREYGGQSWSPMQQMIFNEEMSLARAPRPAGAGLGLVGPTLMQYGTPEQKAKHLPKIAKEELLWCQLFSEPNAGSDLAGLQTKAEDKGDYFLVNGRKIWSSDAHRAQWGLLLARTNPDVPKHKGISTFLLEMSLPGITVHPIVTMVREWRAVGTHNFSEVVLENVRVPRDCLVGEKDKGWLQAVTGLESERSNLAATISVRRFLDELLEYIKTMPSRQRERIRQTGLHHQLAQVAMDLQVAKALGYAIVSKQMRKQSPSREASQTKLFVTELEQRAARIGMQALGLAGQLERGDRKAPMLGRVERLYQISVASTIGVGTSEIQRNIIAARGLGLPAAK